jgi:pimeloyl-ACP methyl ester carboxylesterase
MDKRTKGAWLLAHSKNLDHVSGPGALRLENISYAGKIGRLYNVLRRGSDEARATVIDAATVTNPATTSTRARFRGPQRDAKLKRVRSSALSTYVTILLALTIFLIGNSQMSMADTISRYIRKSFAADTVIVFVHGIMGDGVSTWTSENDSYWPRMLTEDHAFDGADIFVYSYPTAFWATLSIDELAENMRSVLIADGVSNYQKIVFLSHSMGGLVTRAYLLKNRKVAEHTFFAYFFSTPTTGSQIASIAQYLSSNPQFTKMRSLNAEDYLADLSRQWLAASFSFPSYCAYEKRATKGVSLVVNMGSAIALCTKPVDPIDADHIGIVKPTSQNSASYRVQSRIYGPKPRHLRPP